MIATIAARLGVLGRWGRLATAFAAGAIATAALPPYHIIPALWLAVPVLLWLLDGCASWRGALLVGWAFGFGHFLLGLSWIAHAFYVDAQAFGVLAWPAVVGLAFGLGIFFAAAAMITQLIPPAPRDGAAVVLCRRTAARALLLAAAWMLQEWVRNWILTGFPWNPMATIWSETATPIGLAIQQSVSVIGTFGLSLVTVGAAALLAPLGVVPRLRESAAWAIAPLVLLGLMAAAGAARLAAHPTTYVAGVKFRLVQPNVPQAEKWIPELRETLLRDYIRMSTDNRPADVNVVVWGESSVSYLLDRDRPHRELAALAAPENGLLIAGGDRAESETRIFNSLYVMDRSGAVRATYDKFHLVPFGEYVPLARYVPLEQLTGTIGFSAGPGLRTLTVPGLPPFSPLICYEVIFPANVVAPGEPRPEWLLNLTNDSWFGTATGPYQHFATARLRAIEEGIPLVRTANTGISAVVDAHGRVIASLGLNQRGIVDAPLPEKLVSVPLFARLGFLIPLLTATIISCAALVMYRRTR